jgi:uncharacterized protein (DUF433 family)
MNQTQWKHLEAHPQSFYTQLFVKGTRIRAEIVYSWMYDIDPGEERTPEQLAADNNLAVEAVREAIAYCETDPPEIEDDHRREREDLQALGVMDADGNYLRGNLPHSSERPNLK